MEFDDENSVPGRVPEVGAIFMSNSATKKECFRQKLFGLPSSQANFVKQVKAGMALFLFEYERRRLHGVFQACSNGAMNIVPHAFSSSGKQFPAQVRFTTIWYCSPLSEHEFRDAIKDNYYEAYKFNFGLSKDKVCRLLSLFSSRKLEDQLPPRQWPKNKVTKQIGNSLGKARRLAEDDRFVMSDRVENDRNVDNSLGPVISTEYRGNSSGKVRRVVNDGRFVMSDRVENEHYVGNSIRPVIPTEYPGNSSGKVRRVADDGRFVMSDRVENEHNLDNSLGPGFLADYPGLCQSNLIPSVYSSKPILETGYSLVQDQLGPSFAVPCSMSPQISDLSCSTSRGDAIVTSSQPYDPEAPSIRYRRSSSFGVNYSSNSVQEYAPPYTTSVSNLFPSSKNQSFPFHEEPKGVSGCPNVTSGFGFHVPLPTPSHYDSCSRTSVPFSGAGYSENRVIESYDLEGYKGLSFAESALASTPFSRSGRYGRENMGTSPYAFSPSKNPTFVFDSEYPVASHDKFECKIPWHDSNEAFTANVPLSNEEQCHLQGGVYSLNSRSLDFCENAQINSDFEYYQNFGHMHSSPKNRSSVFSRLTWAPEVHIQGNDTHVGYDESAMDTSVDEVMEMVHHNEYHLVKMRKSKLLMEHYDENFRTKKQTTFYSQIEGDHSAMIPIELNIDPTLANEENGNQMAEQTSFVGFKRRSEMRKVQDETKTRDSVESAENEGTSRLRKRRKLFRPNFSNNESPYDKVITGNSSQNLQLSSQEISVSKDDTRNSEALVKSHENENRLSQNFGMLPVMCPIGCEGNNTDKERSSNCKEVRKEESCGTSITSGGEDGKGLLQNFGIQNALSSPCKEKSDNAEERLSIKDSAVDGSSQDHCGTIASRSNVQESSSEIL